MDSNSENSQNAVDNANGLPYNDLINDVNMVVKMDEQRPINDTSCTHAQLTPDPEDTIGDAVMHMCNNPKCGIGFYIKT